MNLVRAYLKSRAEIPDGELAWFLAQTSERRYAKDELFCAAGDVSDDVGFILSGVFRVFYTSVDGDLHTRNFCRAGEPVAPFATILQGRPSNVSIEALVDSHIVKFPHALLRSAFQRHPAWEKLGRRVAEDIYIKREEREHSFLALSAEERYEQFLCDFPDLAAELRQKVIASYVGVTPEALSRLTSRRGRR